MLIVGLDPGSIRCGYAVLDDDGTGSPRYVECGSINAPANDNGWKRIVYITDAVREILTEFDVGVGDKVGVETAYVPHGRTRGVETLAAVRGALVYVCVSVGADIVTVSPSTVKKHATGYGGSHKNPVLKEQVSEALRVRFKLRNAPEPDAADALGVALAVSQGGGTP